jgi:hypothetical protein
LEEIRQDLCPVISYILSIEVFLILFIDLKTIWDYKSSYYLVILGQALTVRQIYRISTMYWDDKYGTQSVSNEASFIFSSSSVDLCNILSHMILNLIGVAGGCSNEGDLEQGQSEFDLQFLLVG